MGKGCSVMNRVKSFYGGIHPVYDGKELTASTGISEAPLLERYYVPVSENAGKAPVPVVSRGDKVRKYQLNL